MKIVNSDILASEILKKECVLTDTMRRTGYAVFTSDIMKTISDMEAVDAVPVRHARWIRHEYADIVDGYLVPEFECSECHSWKKDDSDYCPDCGARMDGK